MKQTHSKSFLKGMREIRVGDSKAVAAELKDVIGINTRQGFAFWRDGREAKLDIEVEAGIESVFAKYGVRDPWGE